MITTMTQGYDSKSKNDKNVVWDSVHLTNPTDLAPVSLLLLKTCFWINALICFLVNGKAQVILRSPEKELHIKYKAP